jgi:hypothetical protein
MPIGATDRAALGVEVAVAVAEVTAAEAEARAVPTESGRCGVYTHEFTLVVRAAAEAGVAAVAEATHLEAGAPVEEVPAVRMLFITRREGPVVDHAAVQSAGVAERTTRPVTRCPSIPIQ